VIRNYPDDIMPQVDFFRQLKEKSDSMNVSTDECNDQSTTLTTARPPPTGALDTPENVANFAEYLLVGMTDEEFANKDDPSEHDIRDPKHHHMWIS
jgi:hypothetical protein